MIGLFFRSVLVGFIVAIPVGPLGLLCITHSVRGGMSRGLAVGLGVALSDALLGFLAGMGTAALFQVVGEMHFTRLLGSALLIFSGVRLAFFSHRELQDEKNGKTYLRIFSHSFFLTVTNPLNIVIFAAVFAATGISARVGTLTAGIYVGSGIFLGSLLWWTLLSGVADLLGQRRGGFIPSGLMSKAAGYLLLFLGMLSIWEIIMDFSC